MSKGFNAKTYIQNREKCKQMDICPSWPVYIMVTRHAYGVYDDLYCALYEVRHLPKGEYFISQKGSLSQALKEIDNYHDYHFGVAGHPTRRPICVKNRLVKLL